MKPWIYRPDDLFDCGGLGEHEIVLTAFIDDSEPGKQASVRITMATVEVVYGDLRQTLNVLPHLVKYPYSLRQWEDEIRSDWKQSLTKDWDEIA